MALAIDTFQYLKPTDAQMAAMHDVRQYFSALVNQIDPLIPEGHDKSYTLRLIRDAAMWANVAITRQPDGAPRT